MKRTIIEFINYEIRIIRHDEGQKVDIVNTTGLQVVIRNWG